jgi:hypothetical protein
MRAKKIKSVCTGDAELEKQRTDVVRVDSSAFRDLINMKALVKDTT